MYDWIQHVFLELNFLRKSIAGISRNLLKLCNQEDSTVPLQTDFVGRPWKE